MAGYNKARFVQDLLQKTEGKPSSFTVNLYPDYWSLNNGSRFHYHIPMASLLDDIRAQRIPVDFLEIFDSARVPFYDGCMIVQILDYRPQNLKDPVLEKPEQTRVVLHPNSESLWADIYYLNQRYGAKWADMDALEIEARVLLATTPPLCLDPDPHLSRIANHAMRASMQAIPASLKRKAAAMEPEDDENDKARRLKIIQHLATRPNRPTPSFHLFDALQKARQELQLRQSQPSSSSVPPQQAPSQPDTNPQSSPAPVTASTPTINGAPAQSPSEPPEDKKRGRQKSGTPQAPFSTPPFIRAQTPVVSAPTTHQFVNTHPPPPTTASSPPSNVHSPMQPSMYATTQGIAESLRIPTPSQPSVPQYAQSPRPPRTPVPAQATARGQPPPQPQLLPPTQPQPQPQPHQVIQATKLPLSAAVPNFSPQPANQQFMTSQQPTQNGTQKPMTAANIAATINGRPPQGQNLVAYQQQQQYFRAQRLQASKQTGRATPQTGIPSPAHQAHAALSPVHQASSPPVASQSSAASISRSPMPQHATQPMQIPGILPQQQAQQQAQALQAHVQLQAHQASMPRSPAQQSHQQPVQPHSQHLGFPQLNVRGMSMVTPGAHPALQAAVANAAALQAGVGRMGTPGGAPGVGVADRQHPSHSSLQAQPQSQPQQPTRRTPQPQPQPGPQTPTHQPQHPTAQHPQQSQQPMTQSQMQQLYPQMYSYTPFNMQGPQNQIPAGFYPALGMPNMANMTNMAAMTNVQSIPGMQGVQGMGAIPPGMMASMRGIGRGISRDPQQLTMAAGARVGHVPGAGTGPMQGKAVVQGGMPR